MIKVTLERIVPRNIGERLANYVRTKSSQLSQVVKRRFSTEGSRPPKPLHQERVSPRRLSKEPAPAVKPSAHPARTFTERRTIFVDKVAKSFRKSTKTILKHPLVKSMHTKLSFSTKANKKMWEKVIKENPYSMLCLDRVEDLTSKKIYDLISLIERKGLIVDTIVLPVKGMDKKMIQKLFHAIGKWQTTLPGFTVINERVFNQAKYFFRPSLADLQKCEEALRTDLGVLEMQKIPLNDEHFVDGLSEHIMRVNHPDHPVYITLRDTAKLAKPPINPLTGEADLSPITDVIDAGKPV